MGILLTILLVATTLGILILIPLFVIKMKASMNSARITLNDAWKLYLRKSARKTIFQALSIAQNNNLPISLEQIETHWLAGGDPFKVLTELSINSSNQDVNFNILSAIDLTGRDIKETLSTANKMHSFELKDFPINSFKLDYIAKYKRGFYGAFDEEDTSELENKLSEKFRAFASTWDSIDPINTQQFLLTNTLNTEYWEKVLKAQLIDQKVTVKY